MRSIATLLLCLFSFSLIAIDTTTDPPAYTWDYINTYSPIAVREMNRSGIPASITIAQGIHESSWGRGELSLNSNNHFGIKCKQEWDGGTYYTEDDDYDKDGNLIKSCFRVYNSVEDSYIDHTNFLMERSFYQPLFKLTSDDYVAWAKGLQSCGYATDPNYAQKLIKTIETYQLYQYDQQLPVYNAPVVAALTVPPTIDQSASVETTNHTDAYYSSTTPAEDQSIAALPEMEVPEAFVLPDNYQRNSLKAHIDPAPVAAPEVNHTPIEDFQQNEMDIAASDPNAFAPARVRPAVIEQQTNRAEQEIEENNQFEQSNVQAAPTFSAPSYTLSPPSSSAMVDIAQQELIKSMTKTKGTAIQLGRKPRKGKTILR
ncbi:MAG: glucosaminidase domain-containing protein [Bacteroidota bacterium]